MKTYKEFREAVSKKQQAAIAISKKERGETPKNEAQGSCWDGYEQKGMKKKGDRMVHNCVPVVEENIEEKNVPTNPALWARAKSLAKSKFDVYPSAMQMDGLQNGIRVKVEDGKPNNLQRL